MDPYIAALLSAGVSGAAVYALVRWFDRVRKRDAATEATRILEQAAKDATSRLKEAELEIKEKALQQKADNEREAAEMRADVRERERIVDKREETLNQQLADLQKQERIVEATQRRLAEKIEGLQGVFQRLEGRFAHVATIGKTELVNAVPLTLGSEFGAFAEAFARDRWRTFKCEERLRVINLGGTAVGSGLTAPRNYIFLATDKLREVTGLGLSRGDNLVDQTANADAFVEVSGILKACSANLLKICGDLRLLNMNRQIKLPAVQAGSSIMPGKVNPVILESVMQIGIKVQANDFIVTECASRGSLQINEFMPLLAAAFLESMELLIAAAGMLAAHGEGIVADEAECERQFNASLEIITAFLPLIGYDRATELVETFKKTERTDLRKYLVEELGKDVVGNTLSPQNLMALGHRS